MLTYIVCATACAAIWLVNGWWIAQGARNRMLTEVYMHTALGLFFTLMVCELTVGNAGGWSRSDMSWLSAVGFGLYIPSAILLALSLHDLKHKGKAIGGDPTASTALIEEGIYGVVRQPMTLGMAVWSFALMFVFQSLFSVILGISAVLLFWLSAISEFDRNVTKFGDAYIEYAKRVPMWNILRGMRAPKKGPLKERNLIR